MRSIGVFLLIFALTGCATIKHYEYVSKDYGVQYQSTIGTEVYRIEKTRDLPNAFGKADVWGGKVDEGLTELRFMGLTEDGQVIFRLMDMEVLSNESVFTRYGFAQSHTTTTTTGNASVYGNSAYGSSVSNSSTVHIPKAKARVMALPPNTVEFLFDPREKILKLETIAVEIVDVKNYSISYILHQNAGQK